MSTDFISGLPVTKSGFDAIAVFVDRLTKYVHVVPTTTRCTAKMWTNLFAVHVFANHGMVDEVILDRGPQFAGKFNQHLLKDWESNGSCLLLTILRLMGKQNVLIAR